MMNQYYTQNGKRLVLGQQLGSGGEATVYELQNEPSSVAKIYHQGKCPPAEKLRLMAANPPDDPTRNQGHVSIAWMTDILFNGHRKPVGYVMPKISGAIPIHRLYHPRTRRDNYIGFTWHYLHRTARNLASAVAAIHAKGYVIGDLNESNILVQPTAMVSLVDTDSFQVRNPRGNTFRCSVGKPEYIAPEIQGKRLSSFDRSEDHDCFALSVLIFLLLMEGNHPFRGSGDPPEIERRIQRGLFPYSPGKQAGLNPPPLSLPFDVLFLEIQRYFAQCFIEGHRIPSRRPRARDWAHILKKAESELQQCTRNSHHLYLRTQSRCTWCERTKIMQGKDPFPKQPSTALPFLQQQPLPPIPPSSRQQTVQPQAQQPPSALNVLFAFLQAHLAPQTYHKLTNIIMMFATFPRSKKVLGVLSGLSFLNLLGAIFIGGEFFVYMFFFCGFGAAGYFYYWRVVHWKLLYWKNAVPALIKSWYISKMANFRGSQQFLWGLGGFTGLGGLIMLSGSGFGFFMAACSGIAAYVYWKISTR